MIGVLPEPQISTPNPTPCFRYSTLSLKTTSQVAVLFFPKTLGRCQFQLWVHACFLSLWSLTQGSPSGGPLNAYGGLLAQHILDFTGNRQWLPYSLGRGEAQGRHSSRPRLLSSDLLCFLYVLIC